MTDKELTYAYLAGFIDADGSISIIKTKYSRKTKNGLKESTQYRIKLSAHNCKIEPLQMLQKEFGAGKLRHKKTGKTKLHDNWRPCYEWVVCNTQAAIAIKALLPYLTIKKEQANLCIELDDFRQTYSAVQRRWDPDFSKLCDEKFEGLKKKCNLLNKRGQ